MDFRDLGDIAAKNSLAFTVTLTLTVENPRDLWSAAADRAMAAPGMVLSDVLDTIGPREDPAISECLSMLTAPKAIPGCTLEDFEIRSGGISAQVVHLLPIQEQGSPLLPAANG